MRKKVLIAGTVSLGLLLALILYITFVALPEPQIRTDIDKLLSAQAPGWTYRDLPLADSPGMGKIVADVLQMDSYVYRHYTNSDLGVTLYVAYWKPGKVSTTDAGVHNPDSCWVNTGWTRVDRRHDVELSVLGTKLKPAEFGTYVIRSSESLERQESVLFWHLVGAEVNHYDQQKTGFRSGLFGRIDRLPLFWADLQKYGLNQQREQMFIRITASEPFNKLFQRKEFSELLATFAPLALVEGTTWGN